MNIVYINRAFHKETNDEQIIRPAFLLCDKLIMYGRSGHYLYWHHNYFNNPDYNVSNIEYCKLYMKVTASQPQYDELNMSLKRDVINYEKLINKKGKSKTDLTNIAILSRQWKTNRTVIMGFFYEHIAKYGLGEFEPLIAKNELEVHSLKQFDEKSAQEDTIIELLDGYFKDKSSFLMVDISIYQYFRDSFHKTDEDHFGYPPIYCSSMHVFPFPVMDNKINCMQLEYTRNEMKEVRNNWINKLYEYKEKMTDYSYNENDAAIYQSLIKTIMNTTINDYIEKYNSCIYMRQFDTNIEEKEVSAAYTIVTSVEGFIDVYVRAGIILPYVATQIKERVKRSIKLDSCLVFLYMVKADANNYE